MADVKISDLPVALSVTGADVPIVQGGVTKKAAASLFSGSGGGSFLSHNIARVDPSGSNSTGTVGDLSKPFLTVQGAINAFEAMTLGPQDFPIIDIGNNIFTSAVTTALTKIRFVGAADEAGIISSAVVYAKVCNDLVFTEATAAVRLEMWGCEILTLTSTSAGGLKLLLENAAIIGDNGVAITGGASIFITGNGVLRGVVQDVITSTGNNTITLSNVNVAAIDSGTSNVTATNATKIDDIFTANNVILRDNSYVGGSNDAGGTTSIESIMTFPDSDPFITNAAYWLGGVVVKSAGN